jgi:hypothetical protein
VAKLPDGTYSAGSLRTLGRVRHIRVSAVVVRRQGSGLALSAGHSVFTVRLRAAARSSASDGSLSPGDEVDVDADVSDGGIAANEADVKETGHTDKLELQGIYLSTTAGVLDVAIVHRGLVHVGVPDGVAVPKLTAGDEVSLTVTLNADDTLSLVSIENEESADQGDDSGDGVDIDQEHSEFTVVGILATLSPDRASLKVEHHPEPVSCAIEGTAPTGVTVGDLVAMQCHFVNGRFVLVRLEKKNPLPDDGTGKLAVSGTIAAFDSSNVSVTIAGRAEPVTCALPAGADMLGFAVGDVVQMYCVYDGGRWLLRGLRSDHSVLAPTEGHAYFGLTGTIVDLNTARISIQVAGHPSPVTCAMPTGVDLEGFAIGDSVLLYCASNGTGWKVLGLRSDHAGLMPDGSAWFSFAGTISSLSSSEIALTVPGRPAALTCAVPAGTDLSQFASGQSGELRCRFHDGHFVLAALHTEHASIVLEP